MWLRLQARAGLRAARQMVRQPFNTLLAALVVGIAAALPATGFMLLDNLQRLAGNVSAAPEISVFMKPRIDDAALKRPKADPQARAGCRRRTDCARGSAATLPGQRRTGRNPCGAAGEPLCRRLRRSARFGRC
jgi:cell division protein FtsX